MTRPDLLYALARMPLLTAPEYARLAGVSPRAARSQMARTARLGLTGMVRAATLPPRLGLFYLTGAGIAALARAAGVAAERLVASYSLGQRAIEWRLAAIGRVRAGRGVLLELHAALGDAGGVLEDWRTWPVGWRYTDAGRPHVLLLDGEISVRLPGQSVPWRLGLLWDGDPGLPAALLHEALARLERVRAAPEYRLPHEARVPPVLLITHDCRRLPPGYWPGLLWTTADLIAEHGILQAPWSGGLHAGGAPARPLVPSLALRLDARGRPTPGDGLSRGSSPPAHPDLHTRIDAVATTRAGVTSDREARLLASRLSGSALELLLEIGQHPLLSVAGLSAALVLHPAAVRSELTRLCRHGLVRGWHPRALPARQRRGVRLVRRHVLTPWGVALLAARAGVAAEPYRVAMGLLDDRTQGRQRGFRFLTATLKHTDLITQYYLALCHAVRATGGRLEWRGEWACTTSVTLDGRRATLRPDAVVTVSASDGEGASTATTYFLEVDRGTEGMDTIDVKLDLYAAYRTETGVAQAPILVVCPDDKRCAAILSRGWAQATETRVQPLDLRVTTVDRLAARGPLGSIWYALTHAVPQDDNPSADPGAGHAAAGRAGA